MPELGRFEDHRGVIQDLLGANDGVTEIFTRKGEIRGNHVHEHTVQYTYVVHGRLLAARQEDAGVLHRKIVKPYEMIEEKAGIPHAWQALEDTTVLVFTIGPRSGANYESDTRRLEVPILT